MAFMWPKKLTHEVLSNVLRSTECEVFNKFEKELDDSFTVFYSRPWLGLKPDGEEIDGECDFVIAHPDLGLLALEVKGGAISYSPADDRWTTKDRWGFTHHIKNPVGQARASKHQILDKLRTSTYWKPRRIRARHGVVLPHSDMPGRDLGADMPLRLFCFREAFERNLRDWVLSRYGDAPETGGNEMPLGQDGIRALEKILAYPFQLHVPLGRVLSDDDRAIQLLTQQQFHILRSMECIQRVAVQGAAGTGKTVLAVEEARHCARAGMRTLYTCFNRPLAGHVRDRVSGIEGLEVFNFHELCVRFSGMAGIPDPGKVPDDLLFSKVYPEILVQALELFPELRYDAIIIDEGQDFEPLWWSAIDLALNPAGPGVLRVFFDSNQRVYSASGGLPRDVKLIPIRLTRNLRNTQRIHDIVQRYYNGYAIESIGPEGIATEWIKADAAETLRGQLSSRVSALIRLEKVPPEDIAVLFEHDGIKKVVAGGKTIGKYDHTSCDKSRRGAIIVDTIRRFKGLESLVVVLVVTPSLIQNDELMYVATSRARTHLIMIGHSAEVAI